MADATTWARIEPHARTTDIDVGLAAEVADPLWFLARQMQLGEFNGDDGGSLISVEIRASWSRLSRYHAGALPKDGDGSAAAVPYDATSGPLEKLVESEPIETSRAWRVRVTEGQRLEAALRAAGLDGAIEPLRLEYSFQASPGALPSGLQEQRYAAIFGNRAPDGLAVNDAIAAGTIPAAIAVASGNASLFEATLTAWASTVPAVASGDTVFPPAWQPQRQEYTFAVGAPDFAGGELVLQAPEYDGTGLDWYHVDLAPDATLGAAGAVSGTSKRRYLPKPVTFPGMPVDRFWEIEDGLINLGSIDAGPTDIVRMLVTEYAVIYSPDWFLVPLEMPVGSVGRIDWVTARDTFGVHTLVGTFESQRNDRAGRQFQLARVGDDTADLPYLFLPPASLHGLQSVPLEDVLVQRDEQANMAWIIERVVLGPAGRGVSVTRPPARRDKIPASQFEADLIYQIATEVPSNWAPLVAVPVGDATLRTLMLQRARLLDTPTGTTRGSTGQLAAGIRQLFEEEVTRAGVRLQLLDQVTRWLDGSYHLWRGRRKSPGLGESDAGLFFDYTARQV
jgi:hypothetical protein